MSTEDHIVQPDPKTKIWRYMDFAKFVSLLHTSSLFFSQAKHLGDPFEGSLTLLGFEAPEGTELNAKFRELYDSPQGWRAYTAVNCWHMAEKQSMAMWQKYTSNTQSVAIQTTVERLLASLKDTDKYGKCHTGIVSYSTLPIQQQPGSSFSVPELLLFRKPSQFAYEKEYRVIVMTAKFLKVINWGGGLPISVDLATLIQEIYISPSAQDWFKYLVESLVKDQYKLKVPIMKETVDERPPY